MRKIHTGFSGPLTCDHFVQLKRQFLELATTLLAEPADLIESLTGDEEQTDET